MCTHKTSMLGNSHNSSANSQRRGRKVSLQLQLRLFRLFCYEFRTAFRLWDNCLGSVLTFIWLLVLRFPQEGRMGESGTAKLCPYCGGKGYVSVPVDLPPDDHHSKEPSKTTWVRKRCPLCDGKGGISGDDSAPPPHSARPTSWIGPADISALSRRFGSCSLPTYRTVKGESRPHICKGKRMRQIVF
jgi:hypothetical protein